MGFKFIFEFPCFTRNRPWTSIQDLLHPDSDKHQWLLLQFIVLLMMDAKGDQNM